MKDAKPLLPLKDLLYSLLIATSPATIHPSLPPRIAHFGPAVSYLKS
jgi:hypothetical protein